MPANQGTRDRDLRMPDGGQMLLLAGFLIAGTAIMAIGAFSAIQRTETQLSVQEHQTMLNLFLNTRERAQAYFEIVTPRDTVTSVTKHLDEYLYSQFQTAQALSLQLNATLAAEGELAPNKECSFFVNNSTSNCSSNPPYEDPEGGELWSSDGAECYTSMTYDGTNDGLITDSNGNVVAALFWLKVESTDASLEEYVVIDVPGTTAPGSC